MVEFIAADNPDAAARVGATIYNYAEGLASTPRMGRIGILAGTRELVFAPWPYIAVYKIQGNRVRIIRIRHASRQWP